MSVAHDPREIERLLRTILSRLVVLEEELAKLPHELAQRERSEPLESCVSVPQAARALGMSAKTLRRLIARGEVVALRPEGANVVRIHPSEIARLASGGRREEASA